MKSRSSKRGNRTASTEMALRTSLPLLTRSVLDSASAPLKTPARLQPLTPPARFCSPSPLVPSLSSRAERGICFFISFTMHVMEPAPSAAEGSAGTRRFCLRAPSTFFVSRMPLRGARRVPKPIEDSDPVGRNPSVTCHRAVVYRSCQAVKKALCVSAFTPLCFSSRPAPPRPCRRVSPPGPPLVRSHHCGAYWCHERRK